jgi:hypothetical protein
MRETSAIEYWRAAEIPESSSVDEIRSTRIPSARTSGLPAFSAPP